MVNNSTIGKMLICMSVINGLMSLSSCTDKDFDLDDIDVTVGIGSGELSIPTSSTATIKLSEVLELEDDGDVKEDADGTYRFFKQGDDVEPTEISIDQVTVKQASAVSHNFVLDLSSASNAKTRSTVSIAEEKTVGNFEWRRESAY